LALRFRFSYNPQKLPPDQKPAVKPAPMETQKPGPNRSAGTHGSQVNSFTMMSLASLRRLTSHHP
jgi:hypothetical protein